MLFELRPIVRKQGEGMPRDGKPFKETKWVIQMISPWISHPRKSSHGF
jgi:hypothetical protein